MNDCDVYVLDTGAVIFVWNGKSSNIYEKMQGSKLAQKLRTEHGGGHVVVVEDGSEESLPEDEKTVRPKAVSDNLITVPLYANLLSGEASRLKIFFRNQIFNDHLNLQNKKLGHVHAVKSDNTEDVTYERVSAEKLKLYRYALAGMSVSELYSNVIFCHVSLFFVYRCTDSDGTFKMVEMKTGPLFQSDLDSNVRHTLGPSCFSDIASLEFVCRIAS